MAITVGELVHEPELQLSLLAGGDGLDRDVEWAHTCDLPDPWRWVGAKQALLTNGSTLPTLADEQVSWAKALAGNQVAAIGIGNQMGGPELTGEFLAACGELSLPVFAIPSTLPLVAVAQAGRACATL